ncbi:MAG: hypothetical protein ACK4Y4_09615 [Brevundimonas sp.]
MAQMELFAQPRVVEPTVPTVEQIRARFAVLLAQLRDAEAMPLSEREVAYWRVVAPQMSNWLPADEKAAVCAELDAHLSRLDRKAA